METARFLEAYRGQDDVSVPLAESLPPGTMILSTDGIDRSAFRTGVVILAMGIFAAGFAGGIAFAKWSKA